MRQASSPLRRRQALAWCVHLYTAIGGVVGMFALYAAAEGRTRDAFLLLLLTMFIDATDGMLARRIRVKELLPRFDGAMMDNVIDVLTFIWVPVFIIWREQLLPHPLWTILPVVAALYAYGQTDMKTEDNFFLGFPSYWNVIALYLYWLQPPDVLALLFVAIPTLLTFVPTRYLYPSKNDFLWRTTWILFVLWNWLVIYLLLQPTPDKWLIALSFFFPLYYMAASFWVDRLVRRRAI